MYVLLLINIRINSKFRKTQINVMQVSKWISLESVNKPQSDTDIFRTLFPKNTFGGLLMQKTNKFHEAFQSIDLLCKSMDWFLHDNGLRHERVKEFWWNGVTWNSTVIWFRGYCASKSIIIHISITDWKT